jgi:hypothetical protein
MALEDAVNPMQGVSGPGSFAKRTDLQYQPDQYGAGVEYNATKGAAPLEKAPPTPTATNTEVRQAAERAVNKQPYTAGAGLYDKTNWPHVSITDGVDIGSDRGSSALMMQKNNVKLSDTLAALLPYDSTGEIGILYQDALARGN